MMAVSIGVLSGLLVWLTGEHSMNLALWVMAICSVIQAERD